MNSERATLKDYSQIPLYELLKEEDSEPFLTKQSVRIIDHLDISPSLSSLIKDSTDFPFGDANQEEYNQYTHTVLLVEADRTLRLMYCYADADTPVFVKKTIKAFRYMGHGRIRIEYLLHYLSIRLQYDSPTTFEHSFVHPDSLAFEGFRFFQTLHIKYPTLKEQMEFIKGINNMEQVGSSHLPPDTPISRGKYIIKKKIGNGGFAFTYLAIDNNPESLNYGKEVAIKELFMREFCYRDPQTFKVTYTTSPDGKRFVQIALNKFKGEIEKIRMCNHPNIIHIFNTFSENNTHYYVMEYLPGGSLEERMVKNGTFFPEEEALSYIRGIASALKEMHGMRLLHLDVKPSNILVRETGEPVLIDFGATKYYDSYGHQCTGNPLVRSYGYESPEQRNQQLTAFLPQADVYSLAITLHYLLYNFLPQSGYWNRRDHGSANKAIKLAITRDENVRLKTIDDFLKVLDEEIPRPTRKRIHPKVSPESNDKSRFF